MTDTETPALTLEQIQGAHIDLLNRIDGLMKRKPKHDGVLVSIEDVRLVVDLVFAKLQAELARLDAGEGN